MINQGSFWLVLFASVAVYWALPRGKEWFLLLVSFAYVALLDRVSAVMVVVGSLVFHAAANRPGALSGKRRWLGFALVAAAVLALGAFKYIPIIVHGVTGGTSGTSAAEIVVPLGASFFTFKLIGYALDSVRNVLPPTPRRRFVLYMLFFPTFPAGPIERLEPFLKNRERPFDAAVFGRGLTRIVYGLVKKLVLVDLILGRTYHTRNDFYLWTPLDPDFLFSHLGRVSTLSAWQFVANRNFSGYLDFSAYSDIAIGAALLFGYEIGENFDWPIFATNITEFWKRWHISLSSFCQRYVYMPVVGKTRNPYLSIMLTMVVMGLWHAGTLNMLVWGIYHGILLCGFQTWNRFKRRRGIALEHPIFTFAGWATTMIAVVASTSFAATSGVGLWQGIRLFAKLFGFGIS